MCFIFIFIRIGSMHFCFCFCFCFCFGLCFWFVGPARASSTAWIYLISIPHRRSMTLSLWGQVQKNCVNWRHSQRAIHKKPSQPDVQSPCSSLSWRRFWSLPRFTKYVRRKEFNARQTHFYPLAKWRFVYAIIRIRIPMFFFLVFVYRLCFIFCFFERGVGGLCVPRCVWTQFQRSRRISQLTNNWKGARVKKQAKNFVKCWPYVRRDPQKHVTTSAWRCARTVLGTLLDALVIAPKIHQVCEEEISQSQVNRILFLPVMSAHLWKCKL